MANPSAEVTLRQIALFLANLAEKSGDVYWLSSPGFKTLAYISPAYEKIWGRSRSELYENPDIWLESMHPDDFANFHPITDLTDIVGPDMRYDESYRIIRPDGEIKWIIDRGFPIFTPEGLYCGFMGVAMDVSKEKIEMERLRTAYELSERANQAKSEFIANVSHDIRTPFAGISEMAKYLAKKETDPEKKEELGHIVESSQRLLNFLSQVIDFAKMDSGTRPVLFEEFNIKELLKDVAGIMQAHAKHKKIDLRIQYPDDLPNILISDHLRIHRILLNLVGNAVKFTEQGYVEIRLDILKKQENQLILDIIVEDTGIGIPENKINDIFQHFTRLGVSYNDTYRGTGLGLPIAKKFAEEIGGQLRVESELKKGSKFILTLPLTLPKNKKDFIIEHNNSTDKTSKILLVEDDILVQIFTRNIVTRLGYQIDIASCAAEAKKFIKNQNYTIILMDLGLPDQDGISLVEELQDDLPSTTNIIAITSPRSEEYEAKCYAVGMKQVIHKPLTAEKFQDLINALAFAAV